MSRLPFVFLTLLAVGVLTIFAVAVFGERIESSRSSAPLVPVIEADDPVIGSVSPRIVIIEFGDFECPGCAAFAPALKEALRRYPNDLQIVWKDFPILSEHPNALAAAQAAHCAGEQQKFWPMHDELFAGAGSYSETRAVDAASRLEMNADSFRECLRSGRTAVKVERGFQEGLRIGVTGTPTLFINNVRYDTVETFEDLHRIITSLLS